MAYSAKRALTQDEISEVVNGLQGTCQTIDNIINMYIADDDIEGVDDISNEMELCDAIDNALFECATCGWWCEAGDYAENQNNPSGDICSDCNEDEEDE